MTRKKINHIAIENGHARLGAIARDCDQALALNRPLANDREAGNDEPG
jgi:hypothetical protein